jgi:hypothetical protein
MTEKMVPYQNTETQLVCAQNFAASGYFKDAKTAAQSYVKIQFGKELGMGAGAAMASINIIEGRPSLSGAAMAALIKLSGKYKYKIIALTDELCTIRILEDGQILEPDSTFTLAEAKNAGINGKTTWKGYGQDMLFNRAIGRAFRRHTPELAAGGVLYADGEITPAEVEYQPQSMEGAMSIKSISESLDDGSADLILSVEALAQQRWGEKWRRQLTIYREEQGMTGGRIQTATIEELNALKELLTPALEN